MKKLALVALVATALALPAIAEEEDAPKGVPHLDHVFVIMMENHAYSQIIGNANACLRTSPTFRRRRPRA